MDAGERRLSPSIGLINHTASRACSACVARIDCGYRNAGQFRLVGKELAKLGEGPTMQTVALGFSGLNPFANMRQVFNGNRKAGAFSPRNNLLRDAVVDVFAEPGFLPGKFLETALGRLRSLSLKARLTLGKFGSNALDIGTAVAGAVTIESDIDHAEINAKDALNADLFRVRHVADASEIPLSFDVHQINLALAVGEQRPLALSADEWNLDPAFERPDRDRITANEAENPIIEGLGRVLTEMALTLPIKLVGVGNLGNAADCGLCRKLEAFSALRIGQLVKRELLKLGGFPRSRGQPIASLIAAFKRVTEGLFLLSRWQQLDVCNQLHASYIEVQKANVNQWRHFLRPLKEAVSMPRF